MIDFTKSKYNDSSYIVPDFIDFSTNVNLNTGELSNKIEGKYSELTIKKYESGNLWLSGSLHHFFNNCSFNGNNFRLIDIQKSILKISNDLNLNPKNLILENTEIGLNLSLPFSPNRVLDNLLFHRNKQFTKPINANYYQSAKDRYIIKIYNKEEQNLKRIKDNLDELLSYKILNELIENAFRFEIKYTKMQELNNMGVITLLDLANPKFYESFCNLLLREWKEVYFYDYTIDESGLKRNELNLLSNYKNPNYWRDLNTKDRYYHKGIFNQIIANNSKQIKQQIYYLIEHKFKELTKEHLDFCTDILPNIQNPTFRLLHHLNIGCNYPKSEKKIKKVCPITGISLEHEDEGVKYIRTSTLKFLKENEPNIYELLKFNLTHNAKLKPKYESSEFSHLAKQVRNNYYNPKRLFLSSIKPTINQLNLF